jgi:hypothetical protein
MEWRLTLPTQKILSAKIRWKSTRLDFLEGIKMASSSLISSKGPIHQRGVLLISAGEIEGLLKAKRRAREGHQRGLVVARQCSGSPDACNPKETGLHGLPMS